MSDRSDPSASLLINTTHTAALLIGVGFLIICETIICCIQDIVIQCLTLVDLAKPCLIMIGFSLFCYELLLIIIQHVELETSKVLSKSGHIATSAPALCVRGNELLSFNISANMET